MLKKMTAPTISFFYHLIWKWYNLLIVRCINLFLYIYVVLLYICLSTSIWKSTLKTAARGGNVSIIWKAFIVPVYFTEVSMWSAWLYFQANVLLSSSKVQTISNSYTFREIIVLLDFNNWVLQDLYCLL
jgi:hypothetical protein